MTNPDDAKDKFCEELDALISVVNPYDKLIILGDFNGRVGKDHQTREDAYKSIRNTVKKKLRAMHDYWLSKNSLILCGKKEKCHNIARHQCGPHLQKKRQTLVM